MSPTARNRLRQRMAECAEQGRTFLVIYLTHGDPDPTETVALMEAAAAAGADVIELGVPFSDPSADGVVIQAAMERALAAGGGLGTALEAVRQLRERDCQCPVVLFGYYNPIFVCGSERFSARCAEVGVDACLVVDLPIDEIEELRQPLAKRGIDVVPLVAPTSGTDRIERLRKLDAPFVYYISMTGITGADLAPAGDLAQRIDLVREGSGAPVAVGFGIASGADAARIARVADGVVVGSAVVRRIADSPPGAAAESVGGFVAELRAAIDDAATSRSSS